MATDLTEQHNQLAGPIVSSIVAPVIEAGGGASDILVLLESVAAGVIHVVTRLGGEEVVIDTFAAGLRKRVADLALRKTSPKGSA